MLAQNKAETEDMARDKLDPYKALPNNAELLLTSDDVESLLAAPEQLKDRNTARHFLRRVKLSMIFNVKERQHTKQTIEGLRFKLKQSAHTDLANPVEVLRYLPAEELAQAVDAMKARQLSDLIERIRVTEDQRLRSVGQLQKLKYMRDGMQGTLTMEQRKLWDELWQGAPSPKDITVPVLPEVPATIEFGGVGAEPGPALVTTADEDLGDLFS